MQRALPPVRLATVIGSLTIAFVLLVSAVAFAATETAVVTGAADQFGASATTGWVSWTQPNGKRFGTFVRSGGPATAVNTAGTDGYGGGFNGEVLTYQQVPKNDNSGVFTYDVGTTARGAVGEANSKFWEWEPTASGDWVLFARNNSNTDQRRLWHKIILVNTLTDETRVLANASGAKVSLRAGQVSGGAAAWEKCTTTDCQAFFYDIGTEEIDTVASTGVDYAPSLADDGTRYFFRATTTCGQNVRIYRQEPGDADPTLIHTLPNGIYGADAYLDSSGADEDLYYARADCSTFKQDVYEIAGADTATESAHAPAAPGSGESVATVEAVLALSADPAGPA